MEGVCGDEAIIHGVWIVGGDEVEGEEGDGKDGDKAVDAGALVRGEDLPPPDGAIGEDHCYVERDDRCQDVIDVLAIDHLLLSYTIFLSL